MNGSRSLLLIAIVFSMLTGCEPEKKQAEVPIVAKKAYKNLNLYFDTEKNEGWIEGDYYCNKPGSIGDALDLIEDVDFNAVIRLTAYHGLLLSIDGIERLPNLESVNINSSRVSDIGALAKLSKLTSIGASYNQIKVVPDFSGLKNLTKLNVENNPLTDFENLRKLTYVKSIAFSFYPPEDKKKDDEAWYLNDFLKKNGVKSYYYPYRPQTTDEPLKP